MMKVLSTKALDERCSQGVPTDFGSVFTVGNIPAVQLIKSEENSGLFRYIRVYSTATGYIFTGLISIIIFRWMSEIASSPD